MEKRVIEVWAKKNVNEDKITGALLRWLQKNNIEVTGHKKAKFLNVFRVIHHCSQGSPSEDMNFFQIKLVDK